MDKDSFKSIPFWSWNGKLEKEKLKSQIEFLQENGAGGFIMHARGGLTTKYLGDEWFEAISFCAEEAEKRGMNAWLYDENGWPSGFAGGELLKDERNRDKYLLHKIGTYDETADLHYDVSGEELKKLSDGERSEQTLNVYIKTGVATADVCNKEVVDKFISLTHEKYAQYFGEDFSKKIVGFFTDEPQYYRWHTPFTVALEEYFKREYGENVYDGVGHLFVEKKGCYEFRWKYWTAMQSLMLENFAANIHGWCKAHGVYLTGHYIEEKSLTGQMTCCAGIMPFYEYMDVPGMDWLTRRGGTPVAPKQLASAAAQLGKKQVLTESFACCGWDVLPKELKYIGDFQYTEGVNLLCQHLYPYSEAGQRKRDHPEHFTPLNPWINAGFKEFNGYFERFGEFIADAEEEVEAAVLQPITSAYLFYKRYEENGRGIRELDEKFIAECSELSEKHVAYHFIDETILKKHGKVDGATLIVGKKKYKYVILPTVYNLNATTATLFKEFIANGGKIVTLGDAPQYLQGERADFAWLKSNCTVEAIINAQAFRMTGGEKIRVTLRKRDGETYLTCLNSSDEKVTVKLTAENASSFEEVSFTDRKTETYADEITFKPRECKVLRFSKAQTDNPRERKYLTLKTPLRVKERDENTLTLDKCRYSFNGTDYSEEMFTMGALQTMLERRYDGPLWIEYSFEARVKPKKISVLAEDTNTESLSVNGVEVKGEKTEDGDFYRYDIVPCVKRGKNTVTVKMRFFEKESVYYALFGDGVTEGLKNCLVYDTTIENIYLTGEFGVYSDTFRKGETDGVYISDGDFYLGKRKKKISNPILDGEPFFAGRAVYAQTVRASEDTDVTLRLGGRFHYADVSVNGKRVGGLLFDDEIDLNGYLVKGKNVIEVAAYNACRNKMGPFHYKPAEEPVSVAPGTFELFGTWKDGKSDQQTDEYRFVYNFII